MMIIKAQPALDQFAALVGGRGYTCNFGYDGVHVHAMISRVEEILPCKPCIDTRQDATLSELFAKLGQTPSSAVHYRRWGRIF